MPVYILIIDDDAMSRDLLGVLLEAEGYAVQSADSGGAALALLGQSETSPRLILTDLQMPGISGASLADQLRRACDPSTPLLLAMSGSQPPPESISCFDGFLLKPFKTEQIAAALAASRNADHLSAGTGEEAVNPTSPKNPPNSSVNAQLQETRPAQSVFSEAACSNPVLNETIYQQLTVAMPANQLREMYTMCLNDARDRIADMHRLVAEHDSASFSRQAHSIKGSCGMLGATQLHGMAAELEKYGLEADGDNSAQDVNSLDELSAACDRLERMLGSRA
jgi:CheY-like chemotaxis protein